jgi:hypothetical protein
LGCNAALEGHIWEIIFIAGGSQTVPSILVVPRYPETKMLWIGEISRHFTSSNWHCCICSFGGGF